MPSSRLVHCRVLGPVEITIDGAAAPAELLWRKHVALLVYLARSPRRGRTRDHLVGMLWGGREEKQARHSLSEALGALRRALGDDRVVTDVDQVRLAADGIVLDCDEYVAREERGDWVGAAALAQGEFLEGLAVPDAGDFDLWLAAERAAWRARMLDAVVRAADRHLAAGQVIAAAAAAQRGLAIDPAHETAARAAMRALALAGDRAGALTVGERLTRALAERLSASPAPETVRLIERIREARLGAGRRATAPSPPPPRPPLVGREVELATLLAAWGRAREGRGQVVLVEGEPGEGKTRLLDELVGHARLDDASVACARAVPADQARPWSGVAGLLLAGLSEAAGLAGAAPGALAALATLDPALGTRHAVAAPLPLSEALVAAAVAASDERPLLLALDDAQWLDGETTAALPGLAREATRRRLLLVLAVAAGSTGGERHDALRARIGRDVDGAAVRVGRWDADALRALVAWALPRYEAAESERLVRRLDRDTAGIPLLAVAMVEAIAAGFKLNPEAVPSPWPTPNRTLVDSLPGDLPPAVIGAVCLRYRGLSGPAQQALAAAAAVGDRVEPAWLAAVLGLDGAVVDAALDEVEWGRWLVADARGYVFRAPIVRDILLAEMITPGQARRFREAFTRR
jgi:DNA-binding SARP family transcriptional activator